MISLFRDGDEYFDQLFDAIARARSEIVFETYIWDRDEIGRKFEDLLTHAALRGVKILGHVDGVGTSRLSSDDVDRMNRLGMEIRIFHPLPWQRKFRFLLPLKDLNKRLHRKFIVVDATKVFFGSLNISSFHSRKYLGSMAWNDVALSGRGLVAIEFREAFLKLWNRDRSVWKSRQGIFLNVTRDEKRNRLMTWLNSLVRSQNRIWICTPYFSPPLRLLAVLAGAAARGCDVRIQLPKRGDVWAHSVTSKFWSELLCNVGVEVYVYTPSVLHAKYTVLDHGIWVGSSNWNFRSLVHDLEVDVWNQEESFRNQVSEKYLRDLESCEPYSAKHRAPAWILLVMRGFLWVFRFWL